MNRDTTKRNWSRFIHRLWLVAGAVWLGAVATVNIGEWASKVPPRDAYEIDEGCRSRRILDRDAPMPTPSPGADAPADVRFGAVMDSVLYSISSCGKADSAIEESRQRLVTALSWICGVGIVPPVVILLIGHALAWAWRGLRDAT